MVAMNQHFVPQFLLRGFAAPDTSSKAVALFNLESGAYVPIASIRGQASKTSLYGRDGAAEEAFARIEEQAAAAVRMMLHSRTPPPPRTREHVALTRFVALQQGRTPAAGKELEATFTGFTRAILRHPSTPANVQQAGATLRVTHDKRELLGALQALEIAPVLDDLASVLVLSACPLKFVCPDTGVAFHNQWAKPVHGLGVLGYACAGLQVLLPLSDHAVLCRYDAGVYVARRAAHTITLTREKDVGLVNKLFCSTAEQQVYFDGSSPTLQFLRGELGALHRVSRAQSVEIARFGADSGDHLIHYHTRQPIEPFPFSWLTVKRTMATYPINERGRAYRPTAQKVAASIREPPPPPDGRLQGAVFSRLED